MTLEELKTRAEAARPWTWHGDSAADKRFREAVTPDRMLKLLEIIAVYCTSVNEFVRHFDKDDAEHMARYHEDDVDWMGHECTVALGGLRTLNERIAELERSL